MALFDWNQNGKKDMVDNYIEYQIYKNATENKETNNYSSGGTNGMSTFAALVAVIGGILIIIGAFKCIKNYLDIKKDNTISSKEMVTGIIFIVIGIIFILLAGVIEALVRLIIGGWILFSGINRLINTLSIPNKKHNFIPYLILSILLIGVGLYTILESNLAFKTIGLVLMVYSTIEIIGYIFNKKNNYIKEEIIIEAKDDKVIDTILIEEKTKKKKKKK